MTSDVGTTGSLQYDFSANRYTLDVQGTMTVKELQQVTGQLGLVIKKGQNTYDLPPNKGFTLGAIGTLMPNVDGSFGSANASAEFNGGRFTKFGASLLFEKDW